MKITMFWLRKPPPPPGHTYVQGRLTKAQETTRPNTCWVEVWQNMSKKQRAIEIVKAEADETQR